MYTTMPNNWPIWAKLDLAEQHADPRIAPPGPSVHVGPTPVRPRDPEPLSAPRRIPQVYRLRDTSGGVGLESAKRGGAATGAAIAVAASRDLIDWVIASGRYIGVAEIPAPVAAELNRQQLRYRLDKAADAGRLRRHSAFGRTTLYFAPGLPWPDAVAPTDAGVR